MTALAERRSPDSEAQLIGAGKNDEGQSTTAEMGRKLGTFPTFRYPAMPAQPASAPVPYRSLS
jgi:hypothetical protein